MGELHGQALRMMGTWSGARGASGSVDELSMDDLGAAPWARPWFSPATAGGSCTACADGRDSELGPSACGAEDEDDDDTSYYSLDGRGSRGGSHSDKPARVELIRRTEYTLVSIAPPPNDPGPAACTPFTLPFGGCNAAPVMPSPTTFTWGGPLPTSINPATIAQTVAAAGAAGATAPPNAECGVYSSVGCPVACLENVPSFPGPEAVDDAPVRWVWFPRGDRTPSFVAANKEMLARAWMLLLQNWDLVDWSLCSVGADAEARAAVRRPLFGHGPGRVTVWFDKRKRFMGAAKTPTGGRVRVGTEDDAANYVMRWLQLYSSDLALANGNTPPNDARRRAIVVDVAAVLLHELYHVAGFDAFANHNPPNASCPNTGCNYPMSHRGVTYWGMEPCQVSYKVVGVVRDALLTRYQSIVAPCALTMQQRPWVCINPTQGTPTLDFQTCP